MIPRLMVAAALVTGVFTATAPALADGGPAEFGCPEPGLPQSITTATVLNHDLSCHGHVEWSIGTGATLDLRGHTVTVDDQFHCQVNLPPCTFDVVGGTLRNGQLRGADVNVRDGRADHLVVHGGLIQITRAGEVTSSLIDRGRMVMASGGRLTRSLVIGGAGVELNNTNRAIQGFVVSDNLILNNATAGLHLKPTFFHPDDVNGTIERNVIAGNAGHGLHLEGDLQDLGGVTISRNLVSGNRGSGIMVSGSTPVIPAIVGGPVTIADNVVLANRGRGIDAPWSPEGPTGVVDGGHNVALFNRTRPACVGVAC